MSHTILVAIDRSPNNQQVFNEALFLAKAIDAKLILLHVLSKEERGNPIMSLHLGNDGDSPHLALAITEEAKLLYHQQWKAYETEGLNILRSFAHTAISMGLETEFTQITGHPNYTICKFARSCRADTIFIGKKRHSGFKEKFLGSVSNYVIHHAPCSVFLVQTPIGQKQPVLKKESIARF